MSETPASPERRRCALITGASAGIGEAFAQELARRHFDLVLVARRQDRLDRLAVTLSERHSIRALALAADLADPRVPQQLAEAVEEAGMTVDLLINNAGYGVPGDYHQQPWEVHADSLQVMLLSVLELTRALLPGMRERGYGRIINIASLAGIVPPTAGQTLYSPLKAFLIRWSRALHMENAEQGVHVTALCPGFTYTEFHDVSGSRKRVSQMPKFMWMDSATVVSQGLDAVMAGRSIYINGRWNRFVATLTKLLPDRLAQGLINRQAKRFRVRDGQTKPEA